MEYLTTVEAAREIGCTVNYLRLIIQRHEELKPKNTFGGSFLWTKDEVEAIKNRNRKLGRPAKSAEEQVERLERQ